jgi:hypothetical protein
MPIDIEMGRDDELDHIAHFAANLAFDRQGVAREHVTFDQAIHLNVVAFDVPGNDACIANV